MIVTILPSSSTIDLAALAPFTLDTAGVGSTLFVLTTTGLLVMHADIVTRRIHKHVVTAIRALADQGFGSKAISRKLDIPQTTVHHHMYA